ncbi:MAG: ATP-binding protein [Ruminococcus flavefaciens]|nr:ATP-binding protein [Ruminococcus flavefaciens]MCM1361466.1 ATP-binding protein [Clostridiales bacterium]MCM1434454.1 ATP-binding protein [Ruminococcus flavefaciens]
MNSTNPVKIPKRIASAVINSLKGGVVPRIGLPYITVGRETEIDALLHDVDIIEDGGASFRFIVGKYGSGKSFLLQTIRSHVMDKNFVVVDADLSPERRLQGTKGQGLATYKELIRNMSTKTRPDGGALTLILDRWISSIQTDAASETGLSPDSPEFSKAVEKKIFEVVGSLSEMVHGFDFSKLLTIYYRSYIDGNDENKAKVVKWFRGEYVNKTEAKSELGVNIIISDDDWYEYIKLFAMFLKKAGYSGMLILIDELVNIYKIPNSITRQYNYEKILTMYNDTLQGKAKYLGIIMGGTPQCIEDTRRGVYSYEALRSRLAEGRFGREGVKDMLAPVIHLSPLNYEEMLVLTEKLSEIHSGLFGYEQKITQNDLINFIQVEYSRIGSDTHITPREVIRDFIELLDIAYQNPQIVISDFIESENMVYSKPETEQEASDSEFAEFEI